MKNGKRYLLVAIALLLATVLFSGLAMAEEPAAKPITKITPEKTAYEVKLEGDPEERQEVSFTVEPADATQDVVASSSDEEIAVATVWDDTVYVRSFKPGKVTITLEAIDADNKKTGVKATFTVDFKEVDAEKIAFDTYSAKIVVDDDGYLDWYFDPEVKPAKATYRDVTWTSSDNTILLVNEEGYYVARKLGKVTVTATTTGAKKITQKAEVEVVAKPVTAISFSPTAFELSPGEELDYTDYMKVEPVGDYDPKTWDVISSDPEIYDPIAGEAGTKEGTATVTVTILNYDGTKVSGSFTVTVKRVALKAISFVKSVLTLNERNEDKINLWQYLKTDPLDAQVNWAEDFIWESSNPQVVSVWYGSLSIEGAGSATVSLYYKDNPAIEASIEVVVSNLAVNNVRFDRKALTLYFVAKPESKEDISTSQNVGFSIEPKDAFVKYITVETSNAKVAVAELDGYEVKVKAVGKGKCKITLYVNDGKTNYTAQLKVTVTDKGPSAKLNYKNLTLAVGKKATLVAKDTNKLKLSGKWSSSDKTIAKVNKKGVVKGVNPGRCVITFTPKSKSIRPLSCQVKVVKPAN